MRTESPRPLSFWTTVRLLLRVTRARSAGRRRRQQELLQQRSGGNATDWGGLGFALGVLVMAAVNVMAAFAVRSAVNAGERAAAERQGKIVVSYFFLESAKTKLQALQDSPDTNNQALDQFYYSSEAKSIARDYGGKQEAIEQKLHDAVRDHGTRDLITEEDAAPGLTA